jgi:IS30 family transposase
MINNNTLATMSDTTLAELRRRYPVEAIARKYGVATSTMYRELARRGIRYGIGKVAKLNPKQVMAIRKQFGKTKANDLARYYGVHPATIRDVWYKASWKWVKG